MLFPTNTKIYLALGITDMRKSINTLSILVEDSLEHDPFCGNYYVFCNRKKKIIKILYFDRNGFAIWQKNLEKHVFKWPMKEDEILEIDHRQLNWLLEGLDFQKMKGHGALEFETLI